MAMTLSGFYKGKKVFVTGSTGFKGAWLCMVLKYLGAEVMGYALEPPTDPSAFGIMGVSDDIRQITGDVRDLDALSKEMKAFAPDIVIHMAAQPLVRESYADPVYTYDVNVMGTVNVLESIRRCDSVRSAVNVTTDKVYKNNEWCWGYRENDALDGYDPYSNSKSCSELVTAAFKRSFLDGKGIAVSACRAGNVIGGGDFAKDRIVPDCYRALSENRKIILRNPASIRPYQHVLEPLFAYLAVAMAQYEDKELAGCYNIGPDEQGCVTTKEIAERFCSAWGREDGWEIRQDPNAVHEANFLRLDCSLLRSKLGIDTYLNANAAVTMAVEWYKAYHEGGDVKRIALEQIKYYNDMFLMFCFKGQRSE